MKMLIPALAALLLLSACNQNTKEAGADVQSLDREMSSVDTKKMVNNTADYKADTTQMPPLGEPEKRKQPVTGQSVPNPDWDKKIIKTASMNIEVKDYNTYYSSFREKVKSLGGYVAQEEQSQSEYKIENTLVIKVPVDQFDNAVALLAVNAEKINERKITSQDVSTEFIDTKSRIEAKKQVRDRYTDLLKQAKNMQEILNVQSEINGVQEEIEAATGRIQYLGHSSAFSTINLTYYQVLNATAKDDEAPSAGNKIVAAFNVGWSWLTGLFIGLVSIWPLFIGGFILVIIYKRTKSGKPTPVS